MDGPTTTARVMQTQLTTNAKAGRWKTKPILAFCFVFVLVYSICGIRFIWNWNLQQVLLYQQSESKSESESAIDDQIFFLPIVQDTSKNKNKNNNRTVANVIVGGIKEYRFPVPPTKWIEDIDTNYSLNSCGARKCFFPSRMSQQRLDEHRRHNNNTNTQQPPTQYGYLVTPFRDGFLEQVTDGWELARNLSKKFSIQHFLRGPPLRLKSTSALSKSLKSSSSSIYRKAFAEEPMVRPGGEMNIDIEIEIDLVVQPVEVAPNNMMMIRSKLMLFRSEHNNNKPGEELPPPLSSSALQTLEFETRLRFDLNATMVLMNSTEGRCLRNDFQVAIDPGTGGIYHLDFDRCFENKKNSFCSADLLNVAELLLIRQTGGDGNGDSISDGDFDGGFDGDGHSGFDFDFEVAFEDPSHCVTKRNSGRQKRTRITNSEWNREWNRLTKIHDDSS